MRYLLLSVLAFLAWFNAGTASAQTNQCSHDRTVMDSTCDTRAQAYAAAIATADSYCIWFYGPANCAASSARYEALPPGSPKPGRYWAVVHTTSGQTKEGGQHRYFVQDCPSGSVWNDATQSCDVPCSSRPTEYGWCASVSCGMPSGGGYCHNGCQYVLSIGEGIPAGTFDPSGATCEVGDQPPPLFDVDGDGVEDGQDAFPNDPNESVDTDGDGIGNNSDFAPNDASNGKDGEGDADGDDEGDNFAAGGGDCNSPPVCSGDGIQCAQLYQQWRIACKGANVTGDPTACSGIYACSGDTAQCAMVAVMRKNACADQNGNDGDANNNGQPDWTEGSAPDPQNDDTEPDDVKRFGIGIGPDDLDTSDLFGGGGSCPSFTITVMSKTVSTADIPQWCNIVAIMRAAILIVCAFTALNILMGRNG